MSHIWPGAACPLFLPLLALPGLMGKSPPCWRRGSTLSTAGSGCFAWVWSGLGKQRHAHSRTDVGVGVQSRHQQCQFTIWVSAGRFLCVLACALHCVGLDVRGRVPRICLVEVFSQTWDSWRRSVPMLPTKVTWLPAA